MKNILEIECENDITLPNLTTVNVVGFPVDVNAIVEPVIDSILANVGDAFPGRIIDQELRIRLRATSAAIIPRAVPPQPDPPVLDPELAFIGLPASVDVDADLIAPGFQYDVTVGLTDDDGSGFSRVIVENLSTGDVVVGTLDVTTRQATVRLTLAASASPGTSNELRATAVSTGEIGTLATGSVLAIGI